MVSAKRSEAPVERSIDVVANNEAKSLVYMSLVKLGQATRSEVDDHVAKRYRLGATLQLAHVVQGFVEFDYSEVFRAKSKNGRRGVQHFRPIHQEHVLPEIGATLDWAREFKIPLHKVLSITASNGTRAPSNSLSIFEAALNGGASLATEQEGYVKDMFNTRLLSLIRCGIIVVEEGGHEPSFKILDPAYKVRDARYENPDSARALIYKTVAKAKEADPERYWTVSELITMAEEILRAEDPDSKGFPAKFRYLLRCAVSIDSPRSMPGVIEKVKLDNLYTSYVVAPAYRDAIADLVERVAKLDKGEPGFRQDSTDKAFEIYDDIDTSRKLILVGLNSTRPDPLH